MEGLNALDLAWLLDGAVNMPQVTPGKIEISTVIVSGGSGVLIGDALNIALLQATSKSLNKPLTVVAPDRPIPWRFRSDAGSVMEFVASETAELDGTRVAVRHFASGGKKDKSNIWITDSGLLLKCDFGDHAYVLGKYRQYKKLIPEMAVENHSSKAGVAPK
jgi:hypothetical protein